MSKRFRNEFWLDLEYVFSGFHREALEERKREQRERERREANRAKAMRLAMRLEVVRRFDIWKATEHIGPNFFGDNSKRYARVKQLYAKKARIEWILSSLYTYWMHGYVRPGTFPKKGLTYSKYRKVYMGHKDTLQEKIKQEKWDKKRAKVRKRRNRSGMTKRAMADALQAMGLAKLKKYGDTTDES